MKKDLQNVLIFFTLVLFFFNSTFYFLYIRNKNSKSINSTTNLYQNRLKTIPSNIYQQNNFEVKEFRKDISQIGLNAWLPAFDFENGMKSIIDSDKKYKEIHYAGASLDENGVVYNSNIENHFTKLNEANINFGLNIFQNSQAYLHNFLSSESKIKDLQTKILDLKSRFSNFASININFENISFEDKDLYLNFLQSIQTFLSQNRMKLYVTILPKTEQSKDSTSTKIAQDLNVLNQLDANIIVMLYDYFIFESPDPYLRNANSPLSWNKEVLDYITKLINKDKLIVGLPLYGYSFDKDRNLITSYTYSQISQLINDNNLTTFETEWGAKGIDFNEQIIYFEDKSTLNKKKELILDYNLENIFYWRVGGDDRIGI